MSKSNTAPRRSRRIASQEPEEMGLPLPTNKRAPKKAAPWDVIAASTRVINGDRNSALSLTKKQRLAIIDNITARLEKAESETTSSAARILELEGQLHVAEAAAAAKRSLRADSMQLQIQLKVQERRAAATALESVPVPAPSQQQQERVTASPPSSPQHEEVPLLLGAGQAAQEPPALPATPLPAWRRVIGTAASLLSPFGRRAASPLPANTTPARVSHAEQQTTTPLGVLTPARKRSAEEEIDTPRPAKRATPAATPTAAKTPRAFLMPSTKNRRVPTSLSTVTEYTEDQSQLGRTLPIGTTPAMPEEHSEFASSLLAGTTPSKPPQRRSIASVRAKRLQNAGTPLPPLSWEQRARAITPAAPAENNADRRFEKAERLRKLHKELAELNKDEDIIEMESHRRKGVKVDDLQYIPHNRPGESSGTFRVPDIDSDDEMEVEMSVPERSNVFEEAVAREPTPAAVAEPRPEEQQQQEEEPMWVFPSVGKRDPNEPRLTHEEEMEARAAFRADYAVWLVEHGLEVPVWTN
ncbi:hypothetical protein LTR87_010181 [Friedmanniomyces endolithicus]|nr:hypothetical protein LTR87_010181 [Friedmanniomyces endolithicus]